MLSNINIINYAADGFTSDDMLKGNCPAISFTEKIKGGDPFP